MWYFSQSSGALHQNGTLVATGYSGHGPGKNNPNDQDQPDLGPIPQGRYTIGPAISATHLGPLAMPLTPAHADATFGRSGFWIHGDSIQHPGDGSLGCICMPHNARQTLAYSTDRQLTVTA